MEPVMTQPQLTEKILLTRLSMRGYKLALVKNEGNSNWQLCKESHMGDLCPEASAPVAVVRRLLAAGILTQDGSSATLSRAGMTAMKRRLTSHDSCLNQHQHVEFDRLEDQHGKAIDVARNMAESPLTWLATRRGPSGKPLIEACHLKAGDRLRADFERGSLMGNVSRSWERLALPQSRQKGQGTEGLSVTEGSMAARQRFYQALDAVGEELSPVLVNICCEHMGLEDTERRHGWPKRTGKVILKLALNKLARHYGLAGSTGSGGDSGRRLHHWGAEDYKPKG